MTNGLLTFNPAASVLNRWFDFEDEAGFHPACDLEETDSAYIFNFDLPGMGKEDLKIEVAGDRLTLTGERKIKRSGHETNRHLTERFEGSFSRTFTFSEPIDAAKIEASFKDGVLKIEVAKPEAVKPFEVKINGGSDKAS